MSTLPLSWISPSDPISIEPDEIHVWRILLEVPSERLAVLFSLLSVDERQRADRFYFNRDRRRFIAAHGNTRFILAEYLRADPASLIFIVNKFGKPELTQSMTEKRLEFNLAHSGDWGLFAVALGQSVGVDIEHIRSDFEFNEITRRNFSEKEMTSLRSLSAEQQVERFFEYWTRKEAYIKAVGMGLSMPLIHIEVPLVSSPSATMISVPPDLDKHGPWYLYTLAPVPGYASALVAANSGNKLYCIDFCD